jgi:dihydroorotase
MAIASWQSPPYGRDKMWRQRLSTAALQERNMVELFDLVILGGTVATPSGLVSADVGIRDGRIAQIGSINASAAAQAFDATGLHVLPGVIDSQVHFREPGNEHKEDLATGTLAAVAGGVTTIFEMPNTNPTTSSPEALADKLARAKGRAWSEHAFYMGATPDNAEQLAAWEGLPGCPGIKLFMGSSTGSLLVEDDAHIARVLANGRRIVAIHAEDEARLRERKSLVAGGAHPRMHPIWRDEQAAILATKRILKLARAAGRRVHVLHVTTLDEAELLADAKDIASMEVTPQHLTLWAPDAYDRLGTLAQMNPPIRTPEHVAGLWRAVQQGVADVLGSDHAPHTLEEKSKDYPNTPSGMTGVQTLVPIMLDHVNAGRLSLERFVDLTAHGPQRVFQLAGKGRIARGWDADFTIVDMKAQRTITNSWIRSRAAWTPYDGQTVQGWPIATLIRGQVVMRDDTIVGTPIGAPARFLDAPVAEAL